MSKIYIITVKEIPGDHSTYCIEQTSLMKAFKAIGDRFSWSEVVRREVRLYQATEIKFDIELKQSDRLGDPGK